MDAIKIWVFQSSDTEEGTNDQKVRKQWNLQLTLQRVDSILHGRNVHPLPVYTLSILQTMDKTLSPMCQITFTITIHYIDVFLLRMRNMNGEIREGVASHFPVGHNTLCPPFAGHRSGKEVAVMVFSERVVACLVLVLLIGHVGHSIRDQAPGDGDAICTDEIIDGTTNLFFANHPVYTASERLLMDSRDYNRLLQGSDGVYIPWQSVDRDNNNSIQVITEVRV